MDQHRDADDHLTAWLREPASTSDPAHDPGGGADRAPGAGSAAGQTTVPGPPDLGASAWGEDDDEQRPRRVRLWALATLPWVVAAGLTAVLLTGGEDDPQDAEGAEGADAGDLVEDPAADSDGDDAVTAEHHQDGAEAQREDAPGSVGSGEAPDDKDSAATDPTPEDGLPQGPAGQAQQRAEALAEAAVLGAPPRAGSADDATAEGEAGAEGGWIDHARAEQTRELDRSRLVVTVVASLLTGTEEQWERQQSVRYGVLVDLERGHVVDPPWPLPAPPPRDPDALVAVDDAEDAVTTALEDAGYEDVSVSGIQRDGDRTRWVRAEVEARAPGGRDRAAHTVWVDRIAETVLGAGAAPAAAPAPPAEGDEPPFAPDPPPNATPDTPPEATQPDAASDQEQDR